MKYLPVNLLPLLEDLLFDTMSSYRLNKVEVDFLSQPPPPFNADELRLVATPVQDEAYHQREAEEELWPELIDDNSM